MEIKQYKYSFGQVIFDVLLSIVISFLFWATIDSRNLISGSWLLITTITVLIIGRVIYLSIMYFIPCLLNKTALELDDDKLQLFIKGKLLFQIPRDVAYWNDIKDIEYTSPPKGSAIISFNMNDGSVFGFRTKYIEGNDKEIYNTIMEYFNKKR